MIFFFFKFPLESLPPPNSCNFRMFCILPVEMKMTSNLFKQKGNIFIKTDYNCKVPFLFE